MPEVIFNHVNQFELLAALADAEWEMYELGSCLNIPGTLRLRLLQAAERARQLIDPEDEIGVYLIPDRGMTLRLP
ncbi:MAG TPA: hypothetical protein VGC82_01725 [Rhodopila sp.]